MVNQLSFLPEKNWNKKKRNCTINWGTLGFSTPRGNSQVFHLFQTKAIGCYLNNWLLRKPKQRNELHIFFCPVRPWKYVDGIRTVMPKNWTNQTISQNKWCVLKPSSAASTGWQSWISLERALRSSVSCSCFIHSYPWLIPPRLPEQGDEIEVTREVEKNRTGDRCENDSNRPETLPLHLP